MSTPPPPTRATSPTNAALVRAVNVELVRRNLTRQWLATETGISPAGISQRLTGRKVLNGDDIDIIADAFGLDPFALLRLAQAEYDNQHN